MLACGARRLHALGLLPLAVVTLDIVMPFWGRADHLRLAVESVLAQSDPDWRLTVIDDAYPDLAPGEWVKGIEDARVTYVRNESNVGVSGAFNLAIDTATGPDLVIMGCDDVLLPAFVGAMKELRDACPSADLLLGGVTVIDAEGRQCLPLADRVKRVLRPAAARPLSLSGERLATSLMRGNWAYFPAIVWRRASIARVRFDPADGVVQDLRAIMNLVFAGASIAVVDTPVFHYRRHATSVSSAAGTDGERFREERSLFHDVAGEAAAKGWSSTRRAATIHGLSRLHALATLPGAALARNGSGVRALVRHGVGRAFD